MAKEDREQTTLGRRLSNARLATIEQIEKRWDQAMDVIHARPIRDPVRDALGGGEQFAVQARERFDYQLRHPGPGEIAERHADLAGDATVDKSQISKIISEEIAQARRVANGWTQKEAEAMNAHLDTKATKEWERSEPDHASVHKAERMADATDPMHDARREQQADNYKRQENNMKSTLAEKKEADIEYWKGVIRRDRTESAEAVQKVQATERNAEQPQAEAAVDRQVKKATSKITPVVVAAMATSFVVNAQAQDINFLEQASHARNESLHIPQQKPLPAQPEQLLPSSGLTCAHVDQWQPVRAQPSDTAPVLGYTQAQIAVEGAAGGGFAHVRYYNGKEGYLPQTSLKPSRTCSIAGVRPNGGPVFKYNAG